ncbi:hypothetical protein ACFFR3_46010 [Nonomuraea salmonea]|uniref:Uncharacterized protein n=1 Tax=Nonomuraea salmonea TaxID=46181 RepID=A0ABV5P343_9ACTN
MNQPLIATCSYKAFQREMKVPGHGLMPCVPVRTSVGAGRMWVYSWYKTGPKIEYVEELAPHGIFGNPAYASATMDVKKSAYFARLDTLSGAIEARLDSLTTKHPGHCLVLLCFEDVYSPDPAKNKCHRTWAAEWFRDAAGWEVPELSPAPAAKPAQPAPATLFD